MNNSLGRAQRVEDFDGDFAIHLHHRQRRTMRHIPAVALTSFDGAAERKIGDIDSVLAKDGSDAPDHAGDVTISQ